MKLEGISVVIPVYNGAETLAELTARLDQALPDLCRDYELILVNDGSRDQSWEVISTLIGQYPWVHGYNLMRNYGQHNALLCGIRAARYPITVTMDDDLQHPRRKSTNYFRRWRMAMTWYTAFPKRCHIHGGVTDFLT